MAATLIEIVKYFRFASATEARDHLNALGKRGHCESTWKGAIAESGRGHLTRTAAGGNCGPWKHRCGSRLSSPAQAGSARC